MLAVLGLILKILLYILLGIIGLIVLILTLLLWVPFRYTIEGEKYEELNGHVKITWLLHLVRVYVDYEEDLVYKAKVLFFTVYDSTLEEDEAETAEDLKESPVVTKKTTVTETKLEVPVEDKTDTKEADKTTTQETEDKQEEQASEDTKEKAKKAKKKKKQKKDTGEDSKLDKALDAYNEFLDIWHEPKYEGIIKHVFKHLFRLVKSILPRRITGKLIIGTGDPATTGFIVGGASVFYAMTKKSFVITPIFMEQVYEGEIKAKGRVILGVLVYHIVRIVLDIRTIRLVRYFMKRNKSNK